MVNLKFLILNDQAKTEIGRTIIWRECRNNSNYRVKRR